MTRAISRQPSPVPSINSAFRSPRRISITLPYEAYQRLLARSNRQGRSLSNLAAYLLEAAMGGDDGSHGG